MVNNSRRRTLESHVSAFLKAIEYCNNIRLFQPQLALIYTLIDQMAWLNRNGQGRDITSVAYIDWVGKYVLPDSALLCDAEDMWGARCSILHTGTAESNISEIGKVRKIYYYYTPIPDDAPQGIEDVQNRLDPNAIFVDIDQLCASVINGIALFIDEIEHNQDLSERVNSRLGKVFTYVPTQRY